MKMYPQSVVLKLNGKTTEYPCRDLYNVSEFVGIARNIAYRHYGENWRKHATIVHVDKWGNENFIYDPINYSMKCYNKWVKEKKA